MQMSLQITMWEVNQWLVQNNRKLFPDNVEWLQEYYSNSRNVDYYLLFLNASWLIYIPDVYQNSIKDFVISDFLDRIAGFVFINNYKYKTLFATTKFDYDPIENYNMVEEGTDNTIYMEKGNNNTGSQTLTNTLNYGKGTTTATASVSPMDTEAFLNADKNIGTTEKEPDTNTQVNGERADNFSKDGTNNLAHKLTRRGNIGTLTTQQMVVAERQLADFTPYLTLWEDILEALCIVADTGLELL